jgi:hypothetical protein
MKIDLSKARDEQAKLEVRAGLAGDPKRYFCHVRFLWRLARSCLRRLCLLIFALRRFFSEPISASRFFLSSVNYFV